MGNAVKPSPHISTTCTQHVIPALPIIHIIPIHQIDVAMDNAATSIHAGSTTAIWALNVRRSSMASCGRMGTHSGRKLTKHGSTEGVQGSNGGSH